MWEKLVWRCLETLKIHVVYHRFSDQDCIFGVGVNHFFFGWTHGALHTFYFWLDLLLPRPGKYKLCMWHRMYVWCQMTARFRWLFLGSSEKACIYIYISNKKTNWKDLGLGQFRDFKWSSTAAQPIANGSNFAGRGWPTISHSPGGSWFQRPPGARNFPAPCRAVPCQKACRVWGCCTARQDLQPVMRYEQLPQYFNDFQCSNIFKQLHQLVIWWFSNWWKLLERGWSWPLGQGSLVWSRRLSG